MAHGQLSSFASQLVPGDSGERTSVLAISLAKVVKEMRVEQPKCQVSRRVFASPLLPLYGCSYACKSVLPPYGVAAIVDGVAGGLGP